MFIRKEPRVQKRAFRGMVMAAEEDRLLVSIGWQSDPIENNTSFLTASMIVVFHLHCC